jgi:hypothetical protein
MRIRDCMSSALPILVALFWYARVDAQTAPDRPAAIEPKFTVRPELEFPQKALGAAVSAKLYVGRGSGKD